jgi:hypothetical protein
MSLRKDEDVEIKGRYMASLEIGLNPGDVVAI